MSEEKKTTDNRQEEKPQHAEDTFMVIIDKNGVESNVRQDIKTPKKGGN
jgi:hypothetical protein